MAARSPPERDPSIPGEQYFPPDHEVLKKYCALRSSLVAEGQDRGALEGVAVLVGVGGDGGDPRDAEVEQGDVVAQFLAERQDPASEAAVDVEADPPVEGDVRERLDRVDGPVPVVAGRADEGDGPVVDGTGHPVGVHPRGDGVDGGHPQLDAEEVAGLVERRVGRLGLDHVGTGDAADRGGVVAVGEHGVADAAGPARRDEADRIGPLDGLTVEQVERHGDDLGLEPGGARAHVPLQHVDVGEQSERLVEEVVVVVVAAVHRARALARLPGGVLVGRHGPEDPEDLVTGQALLGQGVVDRDAVGVGDGAHGTTPRGRVQDRPVPARYNVAGGGRELRWGRWPGSDGRPDFSSDQDVLSMIGVWTGSRRRTPCGRGRTAR